MKTNVLTLTALAASIVLPTHSAFARSASAVPGSETSASLKGPTAGPSPRLLGVDALGDDLLDIDTSTGNGAVVGPVGTEIAGMAYDPNNEILYGATYLSGELVTIDLGTGAATTIGSFGVPDIRMSGLAYDPNDDVLYASSIQIASISSYSLWRIDVTTGAAAFIGDYGPGAIIDGLAYDPVGDTLYGHDGFLGGIYTLDTTTGSASGLAAFDPGFDFPSGLAYDPTLGLVIAGAELRTFDTTTFTTTVVGPVNGNGVVTGLAFEYELDGGLGTKYCVANANSTGSPADIVASGSASSSAGDLTLEASPVPDESGLFFHGANEDQLPFGNGFRCVADNVMRGQLVTGSGNVATYTYDNSILKKNLSAYVGTSRSFQFWFRDPMGGGSSFNTSNGISIDILP